MRIHRDTFIQGVHFSLSPCFEHPVRVKLELYANGAKVDEVEGAIHKSSTINFVKPYFVQKGSEVFTRLEFEQDYSCSVAHELNASLIAAAI
jgi:hypothetical protein